MKTTLTLIAILLGFSISISGQPAGTLDLTFNGTGKVIYDKDNMDLYQDVKVQPDGRIVAVGTSYDVMYAGTIEVTRYMPDGTFDPSFGTGGHFNYNPNIETGAYKCLIKDDGKILVAGYTTDYANYWLVLIQLDTSGNPDPAFGNNGVVLTDISSGEELLYALALQPDGKILAAGYAQNADYRNVPVLLRFSDTGVLDTSFGTSGVAEVAVTESDNDFSAVAVQSDGKIVAAGHISNGMSWFSLLIARFDTNGIADPSYGTAGVVNISLNNVDDEFYDMQLTDTDEALLTGFTVTQVDLFYYMLLMKFDINGQPVAGFGTGGVVTAGDVPYSFGDAMALQTDGKILVTGSTGDLAPSNNDWALWRFNKDGSPDTDFGTNGAVTTDFFGNPDEALGIALYEDKIIVAGKTRNADIKLDFAVARYLNDVGVTVPEASAPFDLALSPNPVRMGGTVNLGYELDQAGTVSVELVSILGNSVVISPAGKQAAGKHTLEFNLPSGISTGVYFIRINGAGSLSRNSKLIITD
jgi:uncharacterized delta-60 repeat protein